MATIEEYRHLRRMAQQRQRRLEQAGFKTPGPKVPKASDVKNLSREMKKLQKWMNDPQNTIKGARVEQARAEQARAAREAEKAAKREAARLRKNAQERERYRKQQEAKGKTVTPRKKLTEDERKERRKESERKYREKKKEEKKKKIQSLEELLKDMSSSTDKNIARQGNWLSHIYDQLRKKGIQPTSLDDLKKWASYFNERNRDKERKLYDFSNWIDEAEAKLSKTASKIRGSDIDRLLKDFEQWKTEDAALAQEFTRDRMPNEYTQDMMGNLLDIYMQIL